MDKAVIIGVYDFLGFHFCRMFLEQGMEVAGLHIEHHGTGYFLEEKRMEIGRNANFEEHLLQEYSWPSGELDDVVIIFDYYDLFVTRREKNFICTSSFEKFLAEKKSSQILGVFLFPVQFLCECGFANEKRHADLFLQLVEHENLTIKKFYLPTVYGPWQSEEFTFQQHFLSGKKELSKAARNNREWLWDAIYVDDTVRSVWNICLNKHGDDEFILTGGKENQWMECARFLSLPVGERSGDPPVLKNAFTVEVKAQRPVEAALKLQKLHVDRLKSQI